jgi:hypothetical protein
VRLLQSPGLLAREVDEYGCLEGRLVLHWLGWNVSHGGRGSCRAANLDRPYDVGDLASPANSVFWRARLLPSRKRAGRKWICECMVLHRLFMQCFPLIRCGLPGGSPSNVERLAGRLALRRRAARREARPPASSGLPGGSPSGVEKCFRL